MFFLPSCATNKVAFSVVISAVMLGCKPTPMMTDPERTLMNELTQNMQTHCVGRYLIDVPKIFNINTTQTVGYKRNVVISSLGRMSKEQFGSQMKQLETQYSAKKHRNGWKYLYQSITVNNEIQLFHRLEDDMNLLEYSRAIEGYRFSNGFVISMVTKATDADMEKPEDGAMSRKVGDDVPQRIALVTQMLNKVQGRVTTDIPKEPGFCFVGGFLPGKAGDGKELEVDEEFRAGFSSKQWPDLSMRFETSTEFQQEETLLQGGNIDKVLTQKKGKVLRKGRVTLSGVPQTEEFLAEGETDNSNLVNGKRLRGHYFSLESNSKISNPLTPRVDFVMRTGNSVFDKDEKNSTTGPSLTDVQAVALWDAVSKTIRLREGKQ